ncbi:ABC transporter permease [Tsukamurella strandjordii]|uniref:ABC transporter permease n=1 Tax=Tsukamurella TaxID=2060 RepID=UPI001C7D8CB1|nr:ABC transporter permease [Tsukamurella sp. TY48]GIZ97762.1 ABC transporter permease [Tsukamurella sp. TY48]
MSAFMNWWRTVGVLVGLELRQRTRATRWRVLLGAFFLMVSAVVFGLLWFMTATSPDSGRQTFGENLYFIVLGFVGFLGLVVAPTMTATSINGDRKDATLAVVQATPAGGLQIAAGKVLGAWIASCALLLVASPYLIWGTIEANYPVWASVLGIACVAVLFLTYCGIGLGYSALLSRPIGSASLTQLTMLFLLIGLPILAALLTPVTKERIAADRPVWTYSDTGESGTCRIERTEVTVEHTERIWWIVAPNPAVVLADAAAQRDTGRDAARERRNWADYGPAGRPRPPSESALGDIADSISKLRTAPQPNQDRTCAEVGYWSGNDTYYLRSGRRTDGYLGHTWYWGLLANLALGGIGVAFAARRLRVPAGNLPRGVRIA